MIVSSDPVARRADDPAQEPASAALKRCCARLYESEGARWLLGESFHPGGLALTARLGAHLNLRKGDRVLDVASGRGASALHLAERFGCSVLGIDYGCESVAAANAEAAARGVSDRVSFRHADAESLPFEDGAFDALVCECAFCTFPDKARAAREFARVLRADGRLGLSDLTRVTELPQELEGLLAWIACIADAQPVERYVENLRGGGFVVESIELLGEVLQQLVQQVRGRLLAAEMMRGLEKIELPGFDFVAARRVAQAAAEAIERGQIGYALITASRRCIVPSTAHSTELDAALGLPPGAGSA
ncbi:MAG: class I SAM-dependent methyltransferase [Steroidobacteraceae bacterium]